MSYSASKDSRIKVQHNGTIDTKLINHCNRQCFHQEDYSNRSTPINIISSKNKPNTKHWLYDKIIDENYVFNSLPDEDHYNYSNGLSQENKQINDIDCIKYYTSNQNNQYRACKSCSYHENRSKVSSEENTFIAEMKNVVSKSSNHCFNKLNQRNKSRNTCEKNFLKENKNDSRNDDENSNTTFGDNKNNKINDDFNDYFYFENDKNETKLIENLHKFNFEMEQTPEINNSTETLFELENKKVKKKLHFFFNFAIS